MTTLRWCNSMRKKFIAPLKKSGLRLISLFFLLHGVSTVAFGQTAASGLTDVAAVAPSAEEMSRMIQSSDTANRLESNTTPAFHLKASFETFDYLGKPDGNGTVDSFWDGTSRFRRVVTYRDHTRTEIHSEKSAYLDSDGFRPSLSMNRLISGFFYPLPNQAVVAHSDLTYKPLELPNIPMDCVMTSLKVPPGTPTTFHGEQSAYCLTKDSHLLRLSQLPQHMTLSYNDLNVFHGKFVPHTLTLMQGSIVRGRMRIEDISDWTSSDDSAFQVPEGSDEMVSTLRVGSGVVSGLAIKHPEPNYPLQAKQNRIGGSVVLHALISRTGDISDLEIVSSPDPSLAEAAMSAVRQWKYKPYLLNGKPVEVDTQINVNFVIGR
jgi:TonB family protein